ncbi:hypothetical protein OUZ56_006545 [Daphnia magna]|uniref:Uncharacterized protein n=1 Tax=Daphnia magna TaxID=35525 RepID=A0ABQ9YW00_9CRUS|nr:hypothetical protein OUZ56_006545 [Daphnia magna]
MCEKKKYNIKKKENFQQGEKKTEFKRTLSDHPRLFHQKKDITRAQPHPFLKSLPFSRASIETDKEVYSQRDVTKPEETILLLAKESHPLDFSLPVKTLRGLFTQLQTRWTCFAFDEQLPTQCFFICVGRSFLVSYKRGFPSALKLETGRKYHNYGPVR